ncbi:hypothetical protein [Colwellia sp. 20A7]|uniref:hypothetical protein n=1 Tax=Colwellia sp. 20A7 TaxID=2689569 RepID=UPI00135CA5BB|nr:hypothetical protein [Colwellia sp. 20A7]
MVKVFSRSDWLEKFSEEQCGEVLTYLVDKGIRIIETHECSRHDNLKGTLVNTLERLGYLNSPNEELGFFQAKDFINIMKGTFRQKKHIKKVIKSGKSKHIYTIYNSSSNHLTKLADQKNLGISETIELLIERGYNYEKEANAKLLVEKKAAKELKADQTKATVVPKVNIEYALPNSFVSRAEHEKVKSELEQTQKLLKELEKKALGHLHTLCDFIARDESSENSNRPLSKQEKAIAKEKYKEKSKALLELVNPTLTN